MKILRHRLHRDDGAPYPFTMSPNKGGQVDHRYLVMHYTAGSSAAGAINTLIKPASKASAHLVIARSGEITQLVPFDRIAWHAGKSRWHTLEGLNRFSIGIELDNAGRLERHDGNWRAWFGTAYDARDVLEATHKHDSRPRGWHLYTEPQLTAAIDVGRLLVHRYGLRDVVGHDDIAPGRKQDPGPAFPMDSFRAAVIGRQEEEFELFETATGLNIRRGPGTEFEKLEASPLDPGTKLTLHARDGSWCSVDVLDGTGSAVETGWVHGDFIRPV